MPGFPNLVNGACVCSDCSDKDPCNCASVYVTIEFLSADLDSHQNIAGQPYWKNPNSYAYVWSEEEDTMLDLVAIIQPCEGLTGVDRDSVSACLANAWGWTCVNQCAWLSDGLSDNLGYCENTTNTATYDECCYEYVWACFDTGGNVIDTYLPKFCSYPCYSYVHMARFNEGDYYGNMRVLKLTPGKKYGVAVLANEYWNSSGGSNYPICHENVNYTWKITHGAATDLDGDAIAEGGGQAHPYNGDNLLEHVSFVAPDKQ